ncbi:hypothetical protein SAMN05421640_3059 [Ekhidna lutea]|uniref:Uncharacterized protein n=1 Tax=Ekhidna lutea TaxID=447679 RepID=A0A239LA15_EKHLU|nr:hypothetical protein [Ekhidna lutea]SNT26822.1 hypothetical protein SAMN05421640_3059 [Ekhidna lutea]
MKSSSIYLIVFLLSVFFASAQDQRNSEINSPGEKPEARTESSSSESLKEQCISLESKIERRKETIQSFYFIEKEVFVGYGEGSQVMTQAIKKHIYKAGQTLIDYRQAQINALDDNNYTDKVDLLREIDRVHDQLIHFSKQEKTRTIEKKLRKLKTQDEIAPVFFLEEE